MSILGKIGRDWEFALHLVYLPSVIQSMVALMSLAMYSNGKKIWLEVVTDRAQPKQSHSQVGLRFQWQNRIPRLPGRNRGGLTNG